MSSGTATTTTTTTTTTTSTTNGTSDSLTTTKDEVAVDHRNHIITVKVTCTTTGCDHATPSSSGGSDGDESSTDDNNNNNSHNGNTSPPSYQCTLIPAPHTLFQQDGETTAIDNNNNNNSNSNNSHQRYIMLVNTLSPSSPSPSPSSAKYSFKVINNDALDDYSISVSVNEQLLGNEEIIVIPKDEVLLDEFYPGGPLSLENNNNNNNNNSNDDDDDDDEKSNENNGNNRNSSRSPSLSSPSSITTTESVMVVISASSVDSIKKKTARVNKRNARYSVVKVCVFVYLFVCGDGEARGTQNSLLLLFLAWFLAYTFCLHRGLGELENWKLTLSSRFFVIFRMTAGREPTGDFDRVLDTGSVL